MARNVLFQTGASLPANPVSTTFYLVDGNLYLGGTKLNNQAEIDAAVTRIVTTETDIKNIKDTLATLTGGSGEGGTIAEQIATAVSEAETRLNTKITTNANAIADEATRAKGEESKLQTAIEAEVTRAQGKETELDTAIKAEVTRAQGAESSLESKISAEATRADAAEKALADRLDAVEGDYYTAANGEQLEATVSAQGTTLQAVKEDVDFFFADALINTENAEAYKDTLKEIQSYIDSDTEAAGQMAANIKSNADAIAAINHADTGILAQAKADATSKADTAQATAISASKEYTNTEVKKVDDKVTELTSTVSNKAEASDLSALSTKVDGEVTKVSTLQTEMDVIEQKATDNANAIATLQSKLGNLGKLGTAAEKDVEFFETPTGAQTKADTAQANALASAKTYTDEALTWNPIA